MSQAPLWQIEASSSTWCKLHGDLPGAIEHMRRALEALEAESGPMLRVSIYWNALADLYLMAGELEEAESAIRTALQRSSQEKSVVCGDNWLMLSAIQQSKQQLEAARRSASEALRIYQEQGHQHGVAQAEVRIASLAETS